MREFKKGKEKNENKVRIKSYPLPHILIIFDTLDFFTALKKKHKYSKLIKNYFTLLIYDSAKI